MPVLVEVPGKGQVEFPDGMTDSQMESAIKTNYPELTPAKETEPAPAGTTVSLPASVVPETAKAVGKSVLGRIGEAVFGSLLPKTDEATRLKANVQQMMMAESVSPTPKGDVGEAPLLTGKVGEIATGIARGGVGTINDLSDFMTSPAGIATLGLGYLPKIAQRVIAAGFAYTMGKEVPAIAEQLGGELGKPEGQRDYTKISELVTRGAATVGFTAGAGASALTPRTQTALSEVQKGEQYATETRTQPESSIGEHQGTEAQRLRTEAGGGNRPAPSATEPKPTQEQVAADPSAVGKEIGYNFVPGRQIGAIKLEGLTAEERAKLEAVQPVQWEFTDPKTGTTFYTREGATRQEILDAAAVKSKQAAAAEEAEKITQAAYQPEPGKVETGANHPEILKRLGVKGYESRESRNTPQFGFVTDKGRFVTREEAGQLATKAGQNLEQFEPGEPVHSDQIESPTEPGKAIAEAEPAVVGMGGAARVGEPAKGELAQLSDTLKTLAKENTQSSDLGKAFEMGKRVEGAKDAVSSAVGGLKAAAAYMKQRLINKPVWTDIKGAIGQRHLELSESAVNARKFVDTTNKAIPDKGLREAISDYIDTGGNPAMLDKAAQETKRRYKAGYEKAKNLTPEQKNIADNIRNYFDARLQDAIDAGVLEDGIENYIHRIYESESPWKNGVLSELRSGVFTGDPALAKKRVFEYDFEAEKAGLHPIKDFVRRIAAYDLSLNKSIADRKLVKSLTDIKMPDGRPMVDIAGIGVPVPKGEVSEATLIKPQVKRIDPNDPKANRGDYKTFDHPALRRWKWAATDASGNPIFVQGDVIVHPDAMTDIKAVFGRSAIRASAVGRAALGVSSTIKQTMLDLSAFHPTQITVHGWEHRTFKPVKEIDFQNPDVRGLIKGGLVVGETTGHELFSEGLTGSSLTRHIPYVGERLQRYNSWLFNDYIPRLKVATGMHALERNRARYPGLSPEEQYHLTANEMNAAFGELNYEMLGRNKTVQDALRLGLLAPDFLEARGRFAGQAGTVYGREQFAALALGAATLYITARIVNKLLSGEYHTEMKNAFSIVYNNKAYSLRTVQGDILHVASEPGRFVYSRLNPVYGRTALEFVTERDAFGRKRDLADQAKDFATTAVPISLRGALNPREQNLFESFLNSIGITERRSASLTTVYDLAQKWKDANKIRTEPGEFIYNPEKDPYGPIRQAAMFSDAEAVASEIEKAVKAGTPANKVREHFVRSRESAFTGSRANDLKFYRSLSEDNKKLFDDAKKEKQQEYANFLKGYSLYVTRKAKK